MRQALAQSLFSMLLKFNIQQKRLESQLTEFVTFCSDGCYKSLQ